MGSVTFVSVDAHIYEVVPFGYGLCEYGNCGSNSQ